MDVERSRARRGKPPAGMLGMIALVAAFESFVARHELDAVAFEDSQYFLARRDAAGQAKGRDLLILGDSQAKLGLLPKVVGARSGLRSYNLAISGAQAPATYDVLRRALEGGARPSAVVVDFHPLLMATPPGAGRGNLPHLLGHAAALRLGWASRDPVLMADLLVRQTLPSLRCRTTLRSWVHSAVAGKEDRSRSLTHGIRSHWARNDGAWVMASAAGRLADGLTLRCLDYPPGWTPDRVNADYLRRFLELAEAHRVTVYWLIPPTHPAIQATNGASGFDGRYVAFVKKMQQRHPGLVVIDGRHTNYDPSVFFDPFHLGCEGAFALSEDLGDLLRRLGGIAPPDRWVALPPYRPRSTAPEVLATRMDFSLPGDAPAVTR